MKPVWAVMLGTIRDQVEFNLILTQLIDWRNKDKIEAIIFSTWRGEIDKFAGLREKLKSANIYIVESTPIDNMIQDMKSVSSNYMRQSRQLKSALDHVPDDVVVLKTRTDRALRTSRYLMNLYETSQLKKVSEIRDDLGFSIFSFLIFLVTKLEF